MEKYLVVLGVFLVLALVVIYTQLNAGIGSNQDKNTFKDTIKKAFPKYTVLDRHDTIIICGVNPRQEQEELVIIRIDPNQKKNIRNFGRRATITYPKQPSIREIKKDTRPYLD